MEAVTLLLHGFAVLLTWKMLALMLVGLLLGIFVGVLPGLGGPNGVAILLPLTFTMDPTSAIVMLSCIYWGALFGGAITSILFNIPGEAWSVATTFDGYPMAQQGKAAEALTAAFTSSFIGSFVAVVLITFLAPRIASFALRFGPPEFFAVYLLTFCSFVGLGREEKHKTVISMALGLLLAAVGMDTVSGQAPDDVRLRPAAARRQLSRRRHRPFRHQRDPADDGGAAGTSRPRGGDQPARRAEGVARVAALLGDAGAVVGDRVLARHHAGRRDCGIVHGLQPRQAILEESRDVRSMAASKACSRRRPPRMHRGRRHCCRCWRSEYPARERRRSCSAV